MVKERPALTVNQWLASVPAERKDAINAVRDAVNEHLPQGYEETVDWGMLAWVVPLTILPNTHNGHPLMLAALNCDPAEGSTALAARIMRESVMLGGKACRPRIAHDGLSHALIEPALTYLETRNVPVRFGKRLRAMMSWMLVCGSEPRADAWTRTRNIVSAFPRKRQAAMQHHGCPLLVAHDDHDPGQRWFAARLPLRQQGE